MDSLRKLEELFTHFPGIGPRQARRFVYYLLSRSPTAISELVKLIQEVKNSSHECSECHRYFIGTKQEKTFICSICSDQNRDHGSIMVVARDSDFESVEKSGAYKGLYFILGGLVPILDKDPEKRIRLKDLLERAVKDERVKEIILSLNTTPEGEHTETIVREALDKVGQNKYKISILGRGLSTGAELEYADKETIKNALQNRH